ncbi:MAG: Na/Pi cotransporter family protein [Gammaproteobacteria bacterium]
MLETAIATAGGLGLFLLGMVIMTDGLRALAGDAMRRGLMRFTRTPLSGAATGAGFTALLQSSSATTVAAIGFVGAGLMSFPNALGIIFGANLGTTMTGWLVALIGFKLKLTTLALPLVLGGALLRLFTRGRSAALGLAVAGFALIFVGIGTLQEGMRGVEQLVSFEALGSDTLFDRLRLVAIGMALAIVTQSSSATVAAALTALNTGLVDLGQAACIVIGADVGTTVTAAIATLGASTGARRTGLSHVIYNIMTGVLALIVLGPYLAFAARMSGTAAPEFLLVAFHSGFNVLGVLFVLPFTRQFAEFVQRIVGARGVSISEVLDPKLLEAPALALDAAQRATARSYVLLVNELDRALGGSAVPLDLARLQHELDALADYLDRVEIHDGDGGEWTRLRSLIHALDHLQRLHERLDEEPERAQTVCSAPDFDGHREAFLDANRRLLELVEAGQWAEAKTVSAEASEAIHQLVKPLRAATSDAIARQALTVEGGTDRFAAVRWLRRVGRHVARVSYHLEQAAVAAGR